MKPLSARWFVVTLVAAALAALSACAGQTQRQAPINPYVDGPHLISQANDAIADLVLVDAISVARAKQLRAAAVLAQEQITLARNAAVNGEGAVEQTGLTLARVALEQLRTFTLTRR